MNLSLLDLKSYFMQVKISSLAQLVQYFKCDAELLRQMLSHWIKKGQIKQCMKTSQCGVKCTQCNPLTVELYEWVAVSN